MQRLKAVAQDLGAAILRPYYPVSSLFRLQREQDGQQIDFMGHIDGAAWYENVRSRAESFPVGGHKVLVASLSDIIESKRAAGRDKDTAVISILEMTLREENSVQSETGPTEPGPTDRPAPRKRPRSG